MGDQATAEHFHAVFLKGQDNLVKLCWNGDYFQQDLPDYLKRSGEVGPGCMADQLIGQWWAHQLGLGYLLPKEKVQTALRSIFKFNWMPDLTGWKHSPRAFAGARDKGLIICTWPKGGRPRHVMLYSDEVWTGIEYQVAAHMLYEGMIEEAFAVVKGARDRYDGVPRPPIPQPLERNRVRRSLRPGHVVLVAAAGRFGLRIRRSVPGPAFHAADHTGPVQIVLLRPRGLGQSAAAVRKADSAK